METTTITRQRENWIDYSKVILIYLMIVCHIGTTKVADTVICSFHMSAFFILSGYLHKNMEFGEGMKKMAKRLIVPVAFFNLLCYAIWLLTNTESEFTMKEYVVRPLLGVLLLNPKYAHPMCMPMWFCVTLFLIKGIVLIRHSRKYHAALLFATLALSVTLTTVNRGGGKFHRTNSAWLHFILDWLSGEGFYPQDVAHRLGMEDSYHFCCVGSRSKFGIA